LNAFRLYHSFNMMLSPSAARMGFWTTVRRKPSARAFSLATGSKQRGGLATAATASGSGKHQSVFRGHGLAAVWKEGFSGWNNGKRVLGRRSWKSTMAAYDSDDSDDAPTTAATPYAGHAQAAKARAVMSHEEAWMINLGRDNDNEWLKGPRNADEWYTGLKPSLCPGVDAKGNIRSLPLPRLDAVTRQAALDYFDNSWTLYETLFAGLNGEEYFFRPPVHGLRHPQIFYYGHTACLYVNKLRVSGVLDKPVNAYFESIFEVGVDEMVRTSNGTSCH
jgi:hypothetical protein